MESFQDLLIKSSLPFSSNLPERNVINFFVCSSFEDFQIERKILNNRIFPKLQEQCFDEFGIEIKLIDIKLGLDSYHETTAGYQQIFYEYLNKHGICDRYNCPIFLLGQKYGNVLPPLRLPENVYKLLLETMKKHKKRFTVDENFLDQFYIFDANSVEPEMILVDIQEIYPDLYEKDRNSIINCQQELKRTKSTLSNLFQNLLKICLSNGSLDDTTATKLFINEFEATISETLRKSLDSEFSPVIFSREIVDIKNFIVISNQKNDNKRKSAIENLIDVSYAQNNDLVINEDLQVTLKQYYNSCYEIYDTVESTFRILWRDDSGVSEEHHQLYIDQFEAYITTKIFEEVAERAKKINLNLSASFLKCYDIICNADLQIKKFAKFGCGYENIVYAMLDYLTDDDTNVPIILYGPPNSGKSIVFARTIFEYQNSQQSDSNCHFITRFVTPGCSIPEIFLSIFLQISAIVLKDNQFETILKNSKEIENNIPNDIEGILYSFQQQSNKKFIIILHDFDKCFDSNSQSAVTDLIPKFLPKNLKLIVSSTENFDDRKPFFLNVPVPEFTQTEFNIFIQTQLNNAGKFLTEDQNERFLLHFLKFTDEILTASIVVDYFFNQKLIQNSNEEIPCETLGEFYVLNLNRWYKRFGKTLVSHCLLYIYCSTGGLTDQEVVEVLNLDEKVMNELFVNHAESLIYDQNSVKFPLSLWLLIKQELSVILVELIKDGYLLIDLATTASIESLIKEQNHYLNDFHQILAGYFNGAWVDNRKSFTFDSKTSEISYYCCPKSQKMYAKKDQNVFYNYRKFRQLVRHLVAIDNFDELIKNVIFDFDYLYNKTKALRVSELLDDFQLARNGGKEILLLEESIRNSAMVIENDLDSLAGELIMQLLPYVSYYPNLRFLIENCDTVAPKHNAFVPIYPSNKLPGSPLASTINCPGAIESVLVIQQKDNMSKELLIKLKNDSRAYSYDLSFGEISYNILLSSGEIYFGPNKDIILVLETEYRQIIKVHQRATGDLLGQIIPMNWVVLRPFEERNEYKITKIDMNQTKVALIITNEVSYLFVLNLKTLEPVLAFNPGLRLEMLKLTPDESTVFTHHVERLVSLNVENNQLNSAVELQGIPFQMLFANEQSKKAFIVCDQQKSVVVLDLESSGIVRKCYKISFENCLDENDYVLEVSCSEIGNSFLLIRSCHSVILYDWSKEKVLNHITRPSQLPVYFKLPNQQENQPASLKFNAAKLILSDRVIICALFRDIIVCTVADNKIIKTLHAPVGGIVSEIHIADDYIIGKVEQNPNSAEVMIWKTDPRCLFFKVENNQDKLTRSVKKLQVGLSVAIASCDESDEMGVIEISTGTLVDLYSHSSMVVNSCLSSCGKWALVTVNSSHNANILWSLETRKIVFEFGSSTTTEFIVPMKSKSGFFCVTNHSKSIDAPNFIVTQIVCDLGVEISFTVKVLEISCLGFLTETPSILKDDKELVFLSNNYQNENKMMTGRNSLILWSRETSTCQNGVSKIITVKELSEQINRTVEDILSVTTTKSMEEVLFVFFKTQDHEIDILHFNCSTGLVIQFMELSDVLPKQIDHRELFLSNNGCYVFYQKTGAIINLSTGQVIGTISTDANNEHVFRCFALKDTILVLSQKTKLFAYRLPEICKIGQVELKDEVSCVSKCLDDFTIMVGCADGSVLSYSLIDVFSPYSFLSQIKVVRNFLPQTRSPTIELEPIGSVNKTDLSQEFVNLLNIKRPISEPIVAHERREFSNIF